MKRQTSQSQTHIDQKHDEDGSTINNSTAQILERVQSDRVTLTKPEEDRRRRTIIVEKKNDSFGFTIQSYGIHYKKEKEIEMITYVDYVDYDGPAYRAGMREGDVILSINGTDMERADHKTLVNYIKNCEIRMRMVVLFEDCVRKVELHMRYIKLQTILENKMEELERLCIRERQLLEGKWKTHSLPARKKASASSQTNSSGPSTPTQISNAYCRPTVSTEDVAKVTQNRQPYNVPPLVFAYQYLDKNYTYMIQPSSSGSGEYLLTYEHQPQILVRNGKEVNRGGSSSSYIGKGGHGNAKSTTGTRNAAEKHRLCHSYGGQLCNPCLRSDTSSTSNGDNASLDAYDLASPCCDSNCIPSNNTSSRHRSTSHRPPKDLSRHPSRKLVMKESRTEETQTDPQPQRNYTNTPTSGNCSKKYFNYNNSGTVVSQCSLHSCTSSEVVAPTSGGATESSNNSYTTSLSTDTLYWDQNSMSRQQNKTMDPNALRYTHYNASQGQDTLLYLSQNAAQSYAQKPKSWDNLTTKAFGGYGFGYGYFDNKSPNTTKSNPTKAYQYVRVDNKYNTPTAQYSAAQLHGGKYFHQPNNKSTESLLSLTNNKYSDELLLSDSSLSCDCVEANSPLPQQGDGVAFFPQHSGRHQNNSLISSPNAAEPNNFTGYYSCVNRRSSGNNSQLDYDKKVVTTSSEATRL